MEKYFFLEEPLDIDKAKQLLDSNFKINKNQKISFICPNCGKLSLRRFDHKRFDLNSPICSTCIKKISFFNKHGVHNPSELKEVVEKRKQTCLEKYGVENPSQVESAKEKARNTCLEKYGVEHQFKSDVVKEKIEKTNLERYGHKASWSNPEVIKKRLKTCIERYGSQNNIAKQKETLKERYGVENSYSIPEVRERAKNAIIEKGGYYEVCFLPKILEKYGSEENFRKHNGEIAKERLKVERNSERCIDVVKSYLANNEFEFIDGCFDESQEYRFHVRCKLCGKELFYRRIDSNTLYLSCPCRKSRSLGEIQLNKFIESLGFKTVANDRTILSGKELDIYIPEKSIAIEFDGAFWHNNIDSSFKYVECAKQGIRLIQIFDFEWSYNQEKIKSYLKAMLNVFDRRIPARKCLLKEVSSKDYRDFCEENHLQGYKNSKIKLGLYYDEELVQVVGCTKRGKHYELDRECSKQNCLVIGGKAKLLKHLVSGYIKSDLVSFCDISKFSGKSYFNAGFELVSMTQESYFYFHKKRGLFSRQQCQKRNLPSLLGENFNANESEFENMIRNGFFKLHTYGNYKFLLRFQFK